MGTSRYNKTVCRKGIYTSNKRPERFENVIGQIGSLLERGRINDIEF